MRKILIGLLSFTICFNVFANSNNGNTTADFHFTENKGQFNRDVEYLCKIHIGSIKFKKNMFSFDLFSAKELDAFHEYRHSRKYKTEKPFGKLNKHIYNMNFIGANSNSVIVPTQAKSSYKNYFIGNDQSRWATNVQSYEVISYKNIYNGVDANIYSKNDHLKYDFIIEPGVNPNVIKIEYQGVEKLNLVNGNLEVILSNEIVKELNPISYQYINDVKVNVKTEFKIDNNIVSFVFPNGYDSSKELIIDPTWEFSTLTGSSSDNWGFTATYDKDGAFYGGGVVFGNSDFFDAGGYDNNANYPITGGAYQTSFGGHVDVAISKFSSDGTALLYSTYIGGSDMEEPHSLVCDSSNNLIILGAVGSTNFPIPNPGSAVQSSHAGGNSLNNFDGIDWDNGSDIFVAKLNAAGNSLLASTYLGGTRNDGLSLDAQLNYNYGDHARGEVIIDANDNIYITSVTNSNNFPTTPSSHDQTGGGGTNYDAVVCKLNPTLTNLDWSTYLGGTGGDAGYSVRVDEVNDKTFICGGTESSGLATAGVIDNSYAGGVDGFIAKFDNANGTLDAYTYLGNGSYNQAFILEIDASQNVYVYGQTIGAYPIVNAAYSQANGAQFIHKMDNNLASTFFSTTFGSGNSASRIDISPTAFLVDNCGNLYISGWGDEAGGVGSTDGMDVTGDAIDGTTQGDDFYFAVIERDAQSLLYGTFFGTNASDEHVDGGTSRFDKKGTIYQGVCAGCGGNNFPTTPGAYSTSNGSSNCNYGAIKISLEFQGVEAQAVSPGDQLLCGAPFDVSFSAGATPPPNTFWDFGDATTLGIGSDYTPSHTYADTGSFTVMYVAIDSSSCNISDTTYFNVTVIENETLSASFNIPAYDPCVDSLDVSLAFTGSGADSLYWNLGDGTTYINDTLVNHTYTSTGDFIITFEAYDITCNNMITVYDTVHFNPNYTTVTAVDPGNQTICNAPFNVNFDAGGTPANTYWDFGDGTTLGVGVDYTPMHTYADTGTYTVMSVAIDSSTCNVADTAYFTITLIQPEQLSASIDIPPYDPCTTGGLTVDYNFTGSGADSLYWDMGTGDVFIDSLSFSYTYNTPGTYYVEFQAYEFACNTSATILDTIEFNPVFTTVTAVDPGNQTICNAPFNVNFDAGGTPANTYWDFGDGTTLGVGVDYTPMHTYADTGTYTVMSVAIDSSTCNVADTAYFTITLIQPEQLSASIDIPPYDPCTTGGLTVDYNFTGSGADSLYWDMGTGDVFIDSLSFSYTYNTPGTYYVEFQAYEFACNTSATILDTIEFNPVFTTVTAVDPGNQTICAAPFNVNFDAGGTPANTFWDFGDGTTLGVGVDYTPMHTYADTGTYTVMSVAIDSSTCNVADTAYFTITLIQPEQLSASIDIPSYDPCQSTLTINLAFTGTGADSLYWNMGNGDTFNDSLNLTYTYTTPGEFVVQLMAYDFDCNNTESISDTIRFFPNNSQVNTTIDPQVDICGADLSVDFSSGNPAPPQNYWNFGDGTTSTQIDPVHVYASAGSYNGFFVAIDSSTCNIADTMYFPITINLTPELDVNFEYVPPVPCEALSYEVDLKASAIGADSIYWNMGDGMEFINDTVVNYEYGMPGTYSILVTLFKDGCPPKTFTSQASFIELGESSGIIPNVFTPNGDGMNDELVFLGIDQTQDYNLRIFNRWGKTVFQSTDANDNWDGKNSEDGTYFYELRYTDICSSEEKLVTGTVTLIGKN